MVQALAILVTLVVSFFRWITGLGAAGTAGSAIIGVVVGTVILKVIDFLALGFVTYSVSNALIDNLISFVRVQLSTTGGFDFVPDLLVTMHFPEAVSMVVSALSIALTVAGTKTVLKLKPL